VEWSQRTSLRTVVWPASHKRLVLRPIAAAAHFRKQKSNHRPTKGGGSAMTHSPSRFARSESWDGIVPEREFANRDLTTWYTGVSSRPDTSRTVAHNSHPQPPTSVASHFREHESHHRPTKPQTKGGGSMHDSQHPQVRQIGELGRNGAGERVLV
jgi:hypothetical protein